MPTWGVAEYWAIVGSLLVLFLVFFVCIEILYSRAKESATTKDGSLSVKGDEPTSNSKHAA